MICSWMMGFVALRNLLDDPGLLHFDLVDDVFVHGVRQPLRRSPVSGTGSATVYDSKRVITPVAESTFVSRPVCVLSSWGLLWATHGLPCRPPVYRGCPCRGPTGVPQSPG